MMYRMTGVWGFALALAVCATSCGPGMGLRSPGVRRLTASSYGGIAWSPDGTTILGLGLFRPDFETSVYAISLEDGQVTQVTASPRQFSLPSWSPQGSIAVITLETDQVWLLAMSSGNISYLAEGEGAVFMPGGNEVLAYTSMASDPSAGSRTLRIVDLEGNVVQAVALAWPDVSAPDGAEYATQLSLSPDGEQLLLGLVDYSVEPNAYSTVRIEVRSGEVETAFPLDQVGSAQWAPDGSMVAIVAEADSAGLGELLLTTASGECLFRPRLHAEVGTVTWSPDSKRIAFLYRGAVYILDLDSVSGSSAGPTVCP